MNNIIYPLDKIDKGCTSIFLAGPSYREKLSNTISWRSQAIELLRKNGFTGDIINPEHVDMSHPIKDWSFTKQLEWETEGLNSATIILFWIPRHLDYLPGFTTNVEFGEWYKSGKVVVGAPKRTPKTKYLIHKAVNEARIPWEYHLDSAITSCLCLIAEKKEKHESRI